MPDTRARKYLLSGLALVVALSCSVFPDEAKLPQSAEAGAGGEPSEGGAGAGAAGQTAPSGGQAGAAETPGPAGAGGVEPSGSAGAAGSPGCETEKRSFTMPPDTWIESAKPSTSHGNEPSLRVVGGANERRAVLSFDLPPLPTGAVPVRVELRLHLESNADATLAERQLEVNLLGQVPNVPRTTWNNYDNGASGQWAMPGGDFGPALSSANVPALIQEGAVTFDLTSAVSELFSTVPVPLPLLVREVGLPPTPAAELAFTSSEGDALEAPALFLEYCP